MDLERIEDTIVSVCSENALAGLAVGIVADGRFAYVKGFGTADASRAIPVTPDTSFRVGSISKTLTAIGIMQLYEQGRLQLDDPVNNYLKAYKIEQPAGAPPVTFRHLLTHTGGIGALRRLGDLFRPVFGLGCKPGMLPTLREYYAPSLHADCAPLVKWAYANHGFATLGQAIEDISGQPFAEYMTEHVFSSLGMKATDYLLSERVRGTLAQGYRMRRRGLSPIPYREIVVVPAGSVFSSLNEILKYVAALLAGGSNGNGRILKSETLAMMMTPQYELHPRMPSMGLAFMLTDLGGHRIAGHNGGWPGFISAMWTAPDDGVGVAVFTNTSTLFAPQILAFELLRRTLNIEPAQLEPPAIIEQPLLWSELCGTYRPEKGWNSNFQIWLGAGGAGKVFIRKGHLMLGTRIPVGPLRKGIRLYPADPNDPLRFRASWEGMPIHVSFKRNSSGTIDTICIAIVAGVFTTLRKKG